MPYFEFIWDTGPGGNVEHLGEHGVSPEEAEHVVMWPLESGPNRQHPERMFARGFTKAGRKLGYRL